MELDILLKRAGRLTLTLGQNARLHQVIFFAISAYLDLASKCDISFKLSPLTGLTICADIAPPPLFLLEIHSVGMKLTLGALPVSPYHRESSPPLVLGEM